MLIIITIIIKQFRPVLGGSCLEIIISEQIGLLTKTSDHRLAEKEQAEVWARQHKEADSRISKSILYIDQILAS